MNHSNLFPGDAATQAYLKRIMADGRWRTSGDIVTRAARDGMVMTPQSAGWHMSGLAREGYLIADGGGSCLMWKARRSQREAAQ